MKTFVILTSKYFCHLERLINLNIQENAELYHCTILFNDDLQLVEWSIYFILRDPVSSNQMTRIYIGVI